MSFMELRNDLHLTSTGRGHELQFPFIFPPSDFERKVTKPLPASLRKEECVKDFYITTTGTSHDFKPTGLNDDLYKKAPGHWHVGYVEDTIKKIQVKPQRKALTMGNQLSEMKSQFTGADGPSLKTRFWSNEKPLPLANSTNKHFSSFEDINQHPLHSPSDRGVFNYHGDIYLTTTRKTHRPFTKSEKSKYPNPDYATYWECNGFPNSRGHGSKTNPLLHHLQQKEKGPMRDAIWFKTATTIPRIPKPLQPVPNTGMCSEVAANYRNISEKKRKELFHCPVPSPWQLSNPGDKEIFSVPMMYRCEYQSIGSEKPVLI